MKFNIILDAKKMQALGVTIDQVKTALQRENVETPGGKVEQGKSDLSHVSWDPPRLIATIGSDS